MEQVQVITNRRPTRGCTRIWLYTVAQPDIPLVRFDRRLVLVRRLGVGDVHHRRTDMVVSIDIRRSCVQVVTRDVHRIIRIDLSVGEKAWRFRGS